METDSGANEFKRYEWDCMSTAIYFGQIEMMTILEERGVERGNNPVHIEAAILSYRNEIVKEIIEEMGPNEGFINQDYLNKAILASSINNNIKGAELLIKNGVNINTRDLQDNSFQKTKLHFILQ